MYMHALSSLLFFFLLTTSPFIATANEQSDLGLLLGEAIEDINFQSFDEAENKLMQVLAAEPNNPYAMYYMGSLLIQTKRPAEAIPYLEYSVQSEPRFEGDQKLLASAYMGADLPEKALPIYRSFYASDPDNEEYIFLYAQSLEKNGEADFALKLYEKLITNNGAYSNASIFQKGVMEVNLGAYQHAISTLQRIDSQSAYGNAATSYITSLEPATKPVSLFVSYEYFYNDNPGSATSTYAKGAVVQADPKGSTGGTAIASVSTAAWEISERLQTKLAYTVFDTAHTEALAQSNDITGHFISPSMTYAFSPSLKLKFKPEYQVINMGEYNLSNNYGGTVTLRYNTADRMKNGYINAGFFKKFYNESFGNPGASVNMQYLDSNSPMIGAGGSMVYSSFNSVFSVDYSLLLERTLDNTNAVLNEKAQDSVFREHSLTLSNHLPLNQVLKDTSLDVSVGYIFKNYLNPQSGTSLPSIKPGNYLTASTTKASVKFLGKLWKDINFTIGFDWAEATSHATELAYSQKRYFGQLSYSY